MTTEYSAHDIHRLDQAYPDALADIEAHIGNPVHKRRLAEVGAEVYAAELTRDLAFSIDNPMSLAGWAAIATVRLMEAGTVWEEDTDAAYAKVDELTAELDRVRADLAAAHNHAHRQDTNLQQIARAKDELAAERDALKQQLAAQQSVIEAARAWVESSVADFGRTGDALTAAVEALPTEAGVAR